MTIINHVCLTIEPGKGQSIPSFNPRNIPGSERNRVTTTLRATSGRLAWLRHGKITPALYTIAPVGVAPTRYGTVFCHFVHKFEAHLHKIQNLNFEMIKMAMTKDSPHTRSLCTCEKVAEKGVLRGLFLASFPPRAFAA